MATLEQQVRQSEEQIAAQVQPEIQAIEAGEAGTRPESAEIFCSPQPGSYPLRLPPALPPASSRAFAFLRTAYANRHIRAILHDLAGK